MGPNAQQGRQRPAFDPAAFNRLARLERHTGNSLPYASGQINNSIDLPNVGYHYRIMLDLNLTGTSAGSVSGSFMSGAYNSAEGRFPAPLGMLPGIKYTLNTSNPIWNTDAYGAHRLALIANRGIDPWVMVATAADIGRLRKEIDLFNIYNVTDAAFVLPGAAIVASKAYAYNVSLPLALTLGEIATAGLIPVQDVRINPQLYIDFGAFATAGVLATVGADVGTIVGSLLTHTDFFVAPPGVRPDTRYAMQTSYRIQSITATGDNIFRANIGGVLLRTLFTMWNVSNSVINAMNTTDTSQWRMRVNQGILIENRNPKTFFSDERRWYSKILPDECYCFDHVASGFGEPGMPSLRDRLETRMFTLVEFLWNQVTTPSSGSTRVYQQELVDLQRLGAMGA